MSSLAEQLACQTIGGAQVRISGCYKMGSPETQARVHVRAAAYIEEMNALHHSVDSLINTGIYLTHCQTRASVEG